MPRSWLLALALLGAAPPALAQGPDARVTLVPFVGGGTIGSRWQSQDGESTIGPGSGFVLGGAVDVRLTSTTTVELLGSYTGSDYSLDLAGIRSRGSGSITLYRAALSVLWRIRDNVPGYFSGGAAALYHSPGRKPGTDVVDADSTVQRVPLFDDEPQWMPGGHIGAGIDLESGDHAARLDLRLYGHRSTQTVNEAHGARYEPKLGLDFQAYLGYLIRL